jgi:dienelactone hydrolase
MLLIAHGNPGVPEDIKFTAAELAKAGYVSLVYDWGSREPPKNQLLPPHQTWQ